MSVFWGIAASAADVPRVEEPRAEVLVRARADLARGDGLAAMEGFERLAASGHSLDAELGLVRAYVQAGQYRRALGFAAHVAGEHAGEPAAALLYAWLLRAGGQSEVASRVLAEASARAPADAALLAATRALAAPIPLPGGVLLEPDFRVAPFAVVTAGQPAVPPQARVSANGTLVDGGRHALVPSGVVSASPTRIWVRNGLGRTSEAEIDRLSSEAMPEGLVLLRLLSPWPVATRLADRDPFAGSVGYIVEYRENSSALPAWPQLRQGFLGSVGKDGRQRLGIEVRAGGGGSPVLDANGALAGVVVASPDGPALFVPAPKWPPNVREGLDSFAMPTATPAAAAGGSRVSRSPSALDEAYERALPIALQVLTLP